MTAQLKPLTFDLEAIRIFVQGIESGSYLSAAGQRQHSASAVHAQLRRLERQCGLPLLQESAGHLALTAGGELIMSYGRRLLALNDEAFNLLHGGGDQSRVTAERPVR